MTEKQEQPKKSRAPKYRLLNKHKVRAMAKERGIKTKPAFEVAMFKFMKTPPDADNSTPRRVWEGKPVDKSRAAIVADFFGLQGDYTQLMDARAGGWGELVEKYLTDNTFLKLQQLDGKMNLIQGTIDDDEVETVPVGRHWVLEVKGSPGQQLFALISSETKHVLLAPLCRDNCFDYTFTSAVLQYPQDRTLVFDPAEGIGFREIVVIKADTIPFVPREPRDGLNLTLEELERFAQRLLDDDQPFEVDNYAFKLVEVVNLDGSRKRLTFTVYGQPSKPGGLKWIRLIIPQCLKKCTFLCFIVIQKLAAISRVETILMQIRNHELSNLAKLFARRWIPAFAGMTKKCNFRRLSR